jgi:hypothetical protein
MNSSWDDSAKAVYEAAMPGYRVIGFIGNPGTPWLSTDALHCRVMGISDIGLLHLSHIPLSGNQPCDHDYTIAAEIIASSHQPVIADSVIIHYQVNGGSYKTALMLHTGGNQYTGTIPGQPGGSTVKYYLTAADASGRHASAPFIGAADPFVFQTVYTNLTAVPDTLWFTTPSDAITGKITQVHNYLPNGVNLAVVQMNGDWLPWYVDSISASVPVIVNSGDSVAIRVKMPLPVLMGSTVEYLVDSMRVTTPLGAFHVIIMIHPQLLSSVPEVSNQPALGPCYPNPFAGVVTIPLVTWKRESVRVDILDMNGRVVKTLVDKLLEPSAMDLKWNGTDDAGRLLPGGIYLCRMVNGDAVQTIRMAFIR